MNNDNNKQDKEQALVAPESNGNDVVMPEKQTTRRGGVLSLLNFLLILSLAGAAGWFWLTQWQSHVGDVNTTTQSLDAKLDALNGRLQTQVSADAKRDGVVGTLADNQQRLQKQLMTIDGRRSHDWVFAEAEYLIRLAGRKLWLEQDVATAVALLNSADLRVASLADSSLLGLRRALAQDIASLNTLPMVDIDGITLALDGIIGQLDSLPINLVELPAATDMKDMALSESPEDWKQNLSKVWDGLVEDFISIHRRTGNIQPLLSIEQRWYLSANLRLALQQAQLSALQHQSERYASSLILAAKLLEGYYDKQTPEVQHTLASLKGLQEKNVAQRLPEDLNSRTLLAELIEKRVKGIPEGTLSMATDNTESQERAL